MKDLGSTISSLLREFINLESSAGILLFSAAIFALILANSHAHFLYDALLHTDFVIQIGQFYLEKPVVLWINDGLMAIYFLLVGLEIKREILVGQLRKGSMIILPAAGALGGLILPALIYIAFNYHNVQAMNGWAIPSATDIAFSLAILSLLRNVPVALKVFLSTLAILDDIAAIVIIAIFYTKELSLSSLTVAAVAIVALFVMNRNNVQKLSPYFLIGLVLWVSVLKSGVHATLAGIVLAMAIPIGDGKTIDKSPLVRAEYNLHPWVTYLILPLFGFANSGFTFQGMTLTRETMTVPIGIAVGLFVGKQLGIFSCCWILIKTNVAKLPSSIRLSHLYGIALLCGVGFTMSLFIGGLAFADDETHFSALVRLGVLIGSALSGISGYLLLRRLIQQPPRQDPKNENELEELEYIKLENPE